MKKYQKIVTDANDQIDSPVTRHIAWGCTVCNKIDWVDKVEATAKPEHVPYRGIDLGSCAGKMIKLYGR